MQELKDPPSPPAFDTLSDPSGFDWVRLYAALLKRIWVVAIVFVVVVAGAAVWTFQQVPIYHAEATVVIDQNPPQVLKNVPDVVEIGTGTYWSSREYFETQYKILKSRALAERVVTRLGLDHNEKFLGIRPGAPGPDGKPSAGVDPVQKVIDAVSIIPVRDSRVATIVAEDADPRLAADLANTLAEEFIEQNVDRKLDTTHNASAWLADQLSTIKKKLEESEKTLYQFKLDHDVLSTTLEARQNISSEKLVAISDTLTKTQLRRVELETRRQGLQELLGESKGTEFKAESFKPVADNPLINDFKREYFKLQSERAEMSERYQPGYPKLVALEERIAKVRSDIGHGIQTVLDAAEGEYRQVVEEERRLRVLLEEAKHEALAVNKLEMEYERLKREKDQNQQVYEQMVKRHKEVDVAGLLRFNNIRLLDAALVPTSPARPHRLQNLLLAVLFGLLLGLGLVVLIEFLDNTVKSQDDVEKALGLPLLGILPSIPGAREMEPGSVVERDLYVSHNPTSAVSECAKSIRTSLLFATPDKQHKILLIASTRPREGKTTTAISIGISMAQSGNRVLLVDGDLRRPRLHRTFQVPSRVGLSTLILGESTVENAVKTTTVDRLHLLPAGPVPPNPSELLQSERYAHVLRELSERFDRIIIDSPPVGLVTDALIMSARCDGLVLVLRSGATPKKAAFHGRRMLHDLHANICGAVLNDVDLGSRAGQYYYYYRYGYYPSEYDQGKGGGGGTPPTMKPEAST